MENCQVAQAVRHVAVPTLNSVSQTPDTIRYARASAANKLNHATKQRDKPPQREHSTSTAASLLRSATLDAITIVVQSNLVVSLRETLSASPRTVITRRSANAAVAQIHARALDQNSMVPSICSNPMELVSDHEKGS